MRYTCQVDLAAPLEDVLLAATSPDQMPQWTPGLARVETVQGERGRAGSVNELHFEGMPGDGVMVERVESTDPAAHHVVYRLGPVTNHQRSSFTALPEGGTRWIAEHEFVLPPGMLEQMGPEAEENFRANTQGTMDTFKAWLESRS